MDDPAAVVAHRDQLVRALRVLTRRERAVLVLRYFADLSEQDTARELGVGVGTVKSATARALAKLRLSSGTDTGSITLYRDGAVVDSVPVPDRARFAVPAQPHTYRLVAETNREAKWWPLWTQVTAEWTFRSSAADQERPLPLLTARFEPNVDTHNRAPGGQPFTFPAHIERQDTDTVAVATFEVHVSYDDGRTWHPATVTRTGTQWMVNVTHPTAGYATLRTKVTDTDGNAVVQTTLRAYEISG